MNISSLLARRKALQQQARLSNFAHAYARLADFNARIVRARLRGEVHLEQAEPDEERYLATLTALEGNQSVIEEHFTDRDLLDFVDAVAFATGETRIDLCFELREIEDRFLRPLRARLESEGVVIDQLSAEIQNYGISRPLELQNKDEEDQS